LYSIVNTGKTVLFNFPPFCKHFSDASEFVSKTVPLWA